MHAFLTRPWYVPMTHVRQTGLTAGVFGPLQTPSRNCPGVHADAGMQAGQTRSDVGVGALDWYCEALHTGEKGVHDSWPAWKGVRNFIIHSSL